MQSNPNWLITLAKKKKNLCALVAVVFCCSPCVAVTFTEQTSTLIEGGPTSLPGWTVVWGDYDADGYVDLLTGNRVYRNNGPTGGGDWSPFTDVFHDTVNGLDGVWGDYDNDGDLDLYSWNGERLFRYDGIAEDGGTTFTTVPMPSIGGNPWGAVWGDWNNDAHLDLFVVGGGTNQINGMLKNNTNGTFSTAWTTGTGNTRGVTAADFDNDGDLDIYSSNYWQGNNFHTNPGAIGTSEWSDSGHGATGSTYTGGAAFGDLDNDGYFDIVYGEVHGGSGIFGHNGSGDNSYTKVYDFDANGYFQDGYRAPLLADYDNDGDLDIFMVVWQNYGNEARLYRNDGGWNFTNVTATEGLDTGMGAGQNMGAGWADFDNDGDMDLVAGERIWVNSGNLNHWLKVKLTGDGTTVNRAAIGSSVQITVDGKTMIRQVEGATGGGSQNDLTLHFGLGSHSGPVDLEIFAPGGGSTIVEGVAVDQTVEYATDGTPPQPPIDPPSGGDFDGDGDVDGDDFLVWQNDFPAPSAADQGIVEDFEGWDKRTKVWGKQVDSGPRFNSSGYNQSENQTQQLMVRNGKGVGGSKGLSSESFNASGSANITIPANAWVNDKLTVQVDINVSGPTGDVMFALGTAKTWNEGGVGADMDFFGFRARHIGDFSPENMVEGGHDFLTTIADGSLANEGDPPYNPQSAGWIQTKIEVDTNSGNAGVFFRDIDDMTGVAIGPWTGSYWPIATGGAAGLNTGFFWTFNGTEDMVINLLSQGSSPLTDSRFDNLVIGGGSAEFAGDADGDGDVDGDDFLIWQNNFPYPGVVATTPEPTSMSLLLCLGGLAMLRWRRAISA